MSLQTAVQNEQFGEVLMVSPPLGSSGREAPQTGTSQSHSHGWQDEQVGLGSRSGRAAVCQNFESDPSNW